MSQYDKILQDKDSITSSGLKTNQIFCYMNKDWLEQRVVKPSVFNKVVEEHPYRVFNFENIHGSSSDKQRGLGSMWKPGFGHEVTTARPLIMMRGTKSAKIVCHN